MRKKNHKTEREREAVWFMRVASGSGLGGGVAFLFTRDMTEKR